MRERGEYSNSRENNLTEEKLNGNGSIEKIILDELGFSSLENAVFIKDGPAVNSRQIPLFAAKDIVAVDCLETSISNKLKLLGYRFWHNQLDYEFGNYDLVKRLLPEGLIRIDDSRDDVLNSDELIELYEEAETVGELTNQTVNLGQNYIKRFKMGSGVVSKLINYGLEREEIIDLKYKINKTISKRISPKYHEFDNEELNETELLGNLGFYPKEIAIMLNLPKFKADGYLSALYLESRLIPKSGYVKKNNELKILAKKVEKLRDDPEKYYSLNEIAQRLSISKPRVVYLIGLLGILGRINKRDRFEAAQKRWDTDKTRLQVEKAIEIFTDRNPEALVDYFKIQNILKDLFPDQFFTIDVIQKRHYELMKIKKVPPTKHNAGKRAEDRLRYLYASDPTRPISLVEESKASMSSYVTLKREYAKAKRSGYASPLKVKVNS